MKAICIERLVLRELKKTDWKAVSEYASDPEVVRYMDWGPETEEGSRDFIRRAVLSQSESPRRDYTLAMVLKRQNKLIGGCGIHVSDSHNREGWLGYCLNRGFWGKGYATEAGTALLTFGFSNLSLHRIFATCDPANIASVRVLEKIGMQREGHLREHRWAKGKWRDSFLYAVLDREWKCGVHHKLKHESEG